MRPTLVLCLVGAMVTIGALGSPVRHVDTEDELQQHLVTKLTNPILAVLAPERAYCLHCPYVQDIAEDIAQSAVQHTLPLDVFSLGYDAGIYVKSQLRLKGIPAVILYTKRKPKGIKYKGFLDAQGVASFIVNNTDLTTVPVTLPTPQPRVTLGEMSPPLVTLTDKNFDKFVGGSKPVFVMFYAPWCAHCKTLLPHFEDAATKAGDGVVVAKFDASAYPMLSKRHGVSQYPSLLYFHEGKTKAVQYTVRRNAGDILHFLYFITGGAGGSMATPMTAPMQMSKQSTYLESLTAMNAAIASKTTDCVIMASHPWVVDQASSVAAIENAVAQLRKTGDDDTLFLTVDVRSEGVLGRLHELGVRLALTPTVIAVRQGTGVAKSYDGELDEEEVYRFILRTLERGEPSRDTTGRVVPVTDDVFRPMMEAWKAEKKDVLLLFYDNQPASKEFKNDVFSGLAKRLAPVNDRIALGKYDVDRGQMDQALALTTFPIIYYFYSDRFEPYTGDMDPDAIVEFVYTELQLTPPPPRVPSLTAETFESIAMDVNKNVLVEFYAPWCGHCKNLAPKYAAFAEAAAEKFPDVVIAKLDADAHKKPAKDNKVDSFPTLLWFGKGEEGKKLPVASSDRTVESLLDFVDMQLNPVPEEEDRVVLVTADTFDTVTQDPTKHVVLEVYAPWCGHCKRLEPVWRRLSKIHEGSKDVVIAKVDGTTISEGQMKHYGVQGYPTILLFSPDAKNAPVKYELQKRDLQTLRQWVTDKTGAKEMNPVE